MVVTQPGHELEGARELQRVLHIQTQVVHRVGVEDGVAARVGPPGAVVGRAHRGVEAACRAREILVAPRIVVVIVQPREDRVVLAEPRKVAAVVALQLRQLADAHAAFGRAADGGVGVEVG